MPANSISSVPGALSFRFIVTVILILILAAVFFQYIDNSRKKVERVSIQQTQTVINSALLVVFASLAAKGRLNELNELEGANPFVHLEKFNITPAAYQGELDGSAALDQMPGWYYIKSSGQVTYVPFYLGQHSSFKLTFRYQDKNHSGRFENGVDRFKNLTFSRLD